MGRFRKHVREILLAILVVVLTISSAVPSSLASILASSGSEKGLVSNLAAKSSANATPPPHSSTGSTHSKSDKAGVALDNLNDELLILSMNETVTLSGDGRPAPLSIIMSIPPSPLADIYRRMFGISNNVPVGLQVQIPDMTAETRPQFLQSMAKQQLVSLGLIANISGSGMTPKTELNGFETWLVGTGSLSSNVTQGTTYNKWQLSIGLTGPNAASSVVKQAFANLFFAQWMLQHLPGKHEYESMWETSLQLPAGATLLNRASIDGLSWRVDFGGGSYMAARASVEDSRILLDEVSVVTQNKFSATPDQIATAFSGYKTFPIDYLLPHSTTVASTVPSVSGQGVDPRIDINPVLTASPSIPDLSWSKCVNNTLIQGPPITIEGKGCLGASLAVGADVSINPRLLIDFNWPSIIPLRGPSLNEFLASFGFSVSFSAQVHANLNGSITAELKQELIPETTLTSINFVIGCCIPVNIDLTLSGEATVEASANAEVTLDVGISKTLSFAAGVDYATSRVSDFTANDCADSPSYCAHSDGSPPSPPCGSPPGWCSFSNFENPPAVRTGPTLTGIGTLKVNASAPLRLSLLFYHLVGPFIEAGPYANAGAKFCISTSTPPNCPGGARSSFSWDAAVGLKVSAGVAFKGFLADLAEAAGLVSSSDCSMNSELSCDKSFDLFNVRLWSTSGIIARIPPFSTTSTTSQALTGAPLNSGAVASGQQVGVSGNATDPGTPVSGATVTVLLCRIGLECNPGSINVTSACPGSACPGTPRVTTDPMGAYSVVITAPTVSSLTTYEITVLVNCNTTAGCLPAADAGTGANSVLLNVRPLDTKMNITPLVFPPPNDQGWNNGTSPVVLPPSGSLPSARFTTTVGGTSISLPYASPGTFTLTVTIPFRPTQTAVSCPQSIAVGQPYTCIAIVSSSSPIPPTGLVLFGLAASSTATAATILGDCHLFGGRCIVTFTPSGAGIALVVATYGGDSFHGASFGASPVTVLGSPGARADPTTTVLACSPSTVYLGLASTCTITVRDTSASPTSPGGLVLLTLPEDGGGLDVLGDCPLRSINSTASSCSGSINPSHVGGAIVAASYGGDPQHAASSSDPVTLTFSIIGCQTQLLVNGTLVFVPDPLRFCVAAEPTNVTISWLMFTGASGLATTQGCTSTVLSVETSGTSVTCTATNGDGIRNSVTVVVKIDKTPPRTSLAIGSPQLVSGMTTYVSVSTPFTLTATDDRSGVLITQYGIDDPSTPNTYTGPFEITTTGTHTVYYKSTDNAGNPEAVKSVTVIVSHDQTTASVSCTPGSVLANTPTTCTVTVTDTQAGGFLAPSGMVSFSSSRAGSFTSMAKCTLMRGSGITASCPVTYTPSIGSQGNHTIFAVYNGDPNHSGSNGNFTISVFDFSVSLTPSTQTVLRGGSASYAVTVSLLPGSTGAPSTVALAVSGLPSDATTTGFPSSLPLPGTTSLNVQTGSASSASLGDFALSITVSNPGGSRRGSADVHIFDFTVTVSPSDNTVLRGASTSYRVSVSLSAGSTIVGLPSSVSISLTGAPSDFTITLASSIAFPSSSSSASATVLNVATGSSLGDFSLTVSGSVSGGSRSNSANLHLYDFGVTLSPGSLQVDQGATAIYTVTMTLITGSSTIGVPTVNLLTSCVPGATCTFNPGYGVPTFSGTASTLVVTTSVSSGPGTYSVTVTAADPRSPEGGNRNGSATLNVGGTVLDYTGTISGEYGDTVSLSANLLSVGTGKGVGGKTVTFVLGPYMVSGITNSAGGATVIVQLGQAAGSYTLSASFAGDPTWSSSCTSSARCSGFANANTNPSFSIAKEDTSGAYTGDVIVSTSVGTFNLRALVQVDAGTETADSFSGTLGNGRVLFYVYGSGTPSTLLYTIPATVTPVAGNPVMGTATASEVLCSSGVTTGCLALTEGAYFIIIGIDPSNTFFASPASAAVAFTVFTPNGSFITGGGWISDPSGSHGSFGFVVRYNSNGQPKGQFVYVYRESCLSPDIASLLTTTVAQGDMCDVITKSNAWIGLQIGVLSPSCAGFQGKASIQVNDESTGLQVGAGGGYQFTVQACQGGASVGTLAIQVLDKNGVLFHTAGSYPTGVAVGGGQIVVHKA